jgi:hypothetical protein
MLNGSNFPLNSRLHGRHLIMISCNEQVWDHTSETFSYGKTTQGVMKTRANSKNNTWTVFKIEYIKVKGKVTPKQAYVALSGPGG